MFTHRVAAAFIVEVNCYSGWASNFIQTFLAIEVIVDRDR
jgi:hypothetical protein